jgi:hypothetical protein
MNPHTNEGTNYSILEQMKLGRTDKESIYLKASSLQAKIRQAYGAVAARPL